MKGLVSRRKKISDIFEPFIQADSSKSRKHHGIGLGLAISKRLVELMGGTITVKSGENKGSLFQVELEFKNVKKAKIQKEGIKVKKPLPLSILLVEDELVSQAIVEALLLDEGYKVTVASERE